MNPAKPPGETSLDSMIELLAFFLERSPALVSFKTLEGRYVYANNELEHLAGMAKSGLIGRSDHEIMPLADAADIVAKDRAVTTSGQAERSLDRFGEHTLASVRFPQMDENGEIVGIGCVAIDVSTDQWDSLPELAELKRAQHRIIELRQALEELKIQAFTDGLTGALSRIRMEQALRDEVQRFLRYGHEASLIFLDVDHFKQINDTLGHAAGDDALRQISQIAQNCLRGSDLVGRWGGEEFLLLMPNTDLTQARLLAEKIRSALLQNDTPDCPLTSASFGVAQIQPKESWESWVVRADTAMYAAKKKGRNRVEVDYGDAITAPPAAGVTRHFVHLVWNPSYECGQPIIDGQHRALFEAANSMISAMIDNWPLEEIKQGLEILLIDVVTHFHDEEELLRAAGYADAEGHAKIHANLVTNALAMSEKITKGDEVIGEAFHLLIYEVIAKHMLIEDRKFFPLFARADQAKSTPSASHPQH